MRFRVALWLLFGTWGAVYSQTITIQDADSSVPLEMVTLMSETSGAFTITNAEGQAEISDFKGAEKIVIRRLGYTSMEISYSEIEHLSYKLRLSVVATPFEEIVVSATRWSQSSKNIPSKIAIISSKDVALQNPQTAADLLASSGEVFVQKSQQGGGSPMIRGFSANRLLYTVDGVRMNSAIFRSGNIQNVLSLDPFAIERTEVFFGPGSVIYGSDAIGGVMSFQTLTPQWSLDDKPRITGKALSRISSANNELTHHFDIGVGWEKWAFISSFSHSKFDDLRMGTKGPEEYLKTYYVQRLDGMDVVFDNPEPLVQNPSGFAQTNMMHKVGFRPNRDWDFQYGFHYSETTTFGRYDRLIETEGNGLPLFAVWNYGPQKWMMHQLSVSHSDGNKMYDRLSLRLANQFFEESRIDRRLNHHRLRTQLEEVQAYSANLDVEKSIGRHCFYYGVEYVLNEVTSKGSGLDIRDNSPILVADRYPGSEWMNYAGYVNYQYLKSEKFIIQAGVRYSAFRIMADFKRHLEFFSFEFTKSLLRNHATTGSIGFVYKPNATWKISVHGSTGFRAPNVDDIGKLFDFAVGEIVIPNTSLKAEYAYNGEFNISKYFGNVFKLDVTGFYTYLDHAMVRRAFQENGQDSILFDGVTSKVYAIQNAAYATVYGFHAGIEIRLPYGFKLSSRYNYQLGEEEMDNGSVSRSRHAAPAFGITRLMYQQDKFSLEFNVIYSAEVRFENLNLEEQGKPFIYARDVQGNPYSPDWYAINFKAMYAFHKHFSVSGGVENITDQRYRPYSSGLVAPGRNVILSLRLLF